MEKKYDSFKDHVDSARFLGHLRGLNGLKLPEKPETELEGVLYGKDEDRAASNVWLLAVYEDAYRQGKIDRQGNIVSIRMEDRPRLDFSQLRTAFNFGREWRKQSKIMAWFLDIEYMEWTKFPFVADTEGWEWIEAKDMALMDCWIAGFKFEDEIRKSEEEPEPVLVLNYDRMCRIREMYEEGIEPAEGEEEYSAYFAYCDALDIVRKLGRDDFIKCLTCPGIYRTQRERLEDYKDSPLGDCDTDCTEAFRCINEECGGERTVLMDYFLVPDEK